jgi:sortase A
MSVLFKKITFGFLLLVLLLCGVWQIGEGAYIHAKAILAQFLLEMAWSETIRTNKEVKPWPWADTWPVSRLTVPSLGINRIVLAGASGSSLAFGPGHLSGSALPGKKGNSVIAGHRDTHFKFLQLLKPGDKLQLQTNAGIEQYYKIHEIRVISVDTVYFHKQINMNILTLVTCYPFNSLRPGGPLRYVVVATQSAEINDIKI